MRLEITNIHGQIGINKTDAVLSIRQPRPNLEITTQPAQLNMHFEQARITIDQKQCFSEAGLKDIFELNRDFADEGRQAVIEGIANIVNEGNRMANIKNKENAIAAIAAEKALPGLADFNIKFIPQSRPKIDVEGGLSFNPQMGKVDIKANIQPVEINSSSPSLEIYLLQKPEFNFKFVGDNVDVKA